MQYTDNGENVWTLFKRSYKTQQLATYIAMRVAKYIMHTIIAKEPCI